VHPIHVIGLGYLFPAIPGSYYFASDREAEFWGIYGIGREQQNGKTLDWLHILPVRVTISQYKSYSANGSHILPVEVIFCQ